MEHSVGYMQRADETNHILKEMEILKEQVVLQQNTSSSKLGNFTRVLLDKAPYIWRIQSIPFFNSVEWWLITGELGEEWLVESLQKAFPNNTSICRTTSNHTGDVLFRVESTGKMIMFEVKDVKKGSITGINQGKDIEKFFKDFDSCGAHGAILISLNGPVDHNVTPLTPQWCQSKPFFYVDCLKTQYPDPVSLLKVAFKNMIICNRLTLILRFRFKWWPSWWKLMTKEEKQTTASTSRFRVIYQLWDCYLDYIKSFTRAMRVKGRLWSSWKGLWTSSIKTCWEIMSVHKLLMSHKVWLRLEMWVDQFQTR